MQNKQHFTTGRIRPTLFFAAIFFFFLFSCNALRSDLTVQPGKRFLLGGNQNGSFTVQLVNQGDVPVSIIERKANGKQVELGVFGPGDRQTVRFSAGSAAFIDNASPKPARLFLTVTGDKDLSMSSQNN